MGTKLPICVKVRFNQAGYFSVKTLGDMSLYDILKTFSDKGGNLSHAELQLIEDVGTQPCYDQTGVEEMVGIIETKIDSGELVLQW